MPGNKQSTCFFGVNRVYFAHFATPFVAEARSKKFEFYEDKQIIQQAH